jgi:TPR repeat protein
MSAGARVRVVVSLLITAVYLALSASAAAQDIDELRRLAQQGDSNAQTMLGMRYQNGDGVQRDDAEAVRWYRKAAQMGNASGQFNLGKMYQNGRGVAQDNGEAVHWYRKSADQGYSMGQNNLAIMYQNGRGVPQDYAAALRWFRKAADQGNPIAQNNLGVMYLSGRGIAKDYGEAVRWFRKAAEQGNSMGQNNLGVMYRNGRGVLQDDAEALRWYQKAADQGNMFGQGNLGWMYENGRGVPQERPLALYWYNKAADQGHAPSKEAIQRLKAAPVEPTVSATNNAAPLVVRPQPEPEPEPEAEEETEEESEPEPQAQPHNIDRRLAINEVEKLLKGSVSPVRVATLVKQYGVNFETTARVKERLRKVGADDKLLTAIAEAYGISLVLTATQLCRVTIYVDGKQVMEGTMDPNSADKRERSFHALRRLVVVAGNPAGVDVTFNGQSTGPLGPTNTKRTITFTPIGVQQ